MLGAEPPGAAAEPPGDGGAGPQRVGRARVLRRELRRARVVGRDPEEERCLKINVEKIAPSLPAPGPRSQPAPFSIWA